ncbi:MAG: hypothetical protein ACRC0V_09230 [Fusobacteriaceae bacterium]
MFKHFTTGIDNFIEIVKTTEARQISKLYFFKEILKQIPEKLAFPIIAIIEKDFIDFREDLKSNFSVIGNYLTTKEILNLWLKQNGATKIEIKIVTIES